MLPLLDKVGCAVVGDFQIDQRHLMLKVSLSLSGTKQISIGCYCME